MLSARLSAPHGYSVYRWHDNWHTSGASSVLVPGGSSRNALRLPDMDQAVSTFPDPALRAPFNGRTSNLDMLCQVAWKRHQCQSLLVDLRLESACYPGNFYPLSDWPLPFWYRRITEPTFVLLVVVLASKLPYAFTLSTFSRAGWGTTRLVTTF